jgi:hypothetical protein
MPFPGPAMLNLVSQLENAIIHSYSFPHLVIHNFLPNKVYEELAETFEEPSVRGEISVHNAFSNKLFLASVLSGHL